MKKRFLLFYLFVLLPNYSATAVKHQLSSSPPKANMAETLERILANLNKQKPTTSDDEGSTSSTSSSSSSSTTELSTADIDQLNNLKWNSAGDIRQRLQINSGNEVYISNQLGIMKENAEKAQECMTTILNSFFNGFVKFNAVNFSSGPQLTDVKEIIGSKDTQHQGIYTRYHNLLHTNKTLADFYGVMELDPSDLVELIAKIQDSVEFCSTLVACNEIKLDKKVLELMYFYNRNDELNQRNNYLDKLRSISDPRRVVTFNEFLEHLEFVHNCLDASRAIFGPFIVIASRLNRTTSNDDDDC